MKIVFPNGEVHNLNHDEARSLLGSVGSEDDDRVSVYADDIEKIKGRLRKKGYIIKQ